MDTALVDALRAGIAGEAMQSRAADTIERVQKANQKLGDAYERLLNAPDEPDDPNELLDELYLLNERVNDLSKERDAALAEVERLKAELRKRREFTTL